MMTLDTNLFKPKPKSEIKYVHNLMDNKLQEFIDEFNTMQICNSNNVKDATDQLNTEILRTMDKIALKQVKKITSRIRKPCYDNDLIQQRQIVKNRERK